MLKFLSQYSVFLSLSVIMHVVIFAFLILGLASTPQLPKPPGASVKRNVIQAVAVDESLVQTELKKLERAEKNRKKQEDDRQKRLQDQAKKVEQQREEEQKKLDLLKKQQQKKQEELKQQELAQERKIKELQKKQEQEKANIEKLRTAALELEKKKKMEEKRQKDLQEKKKAAEKKRQKDLQAKKIAAEKKRQKDLQAKKAAEAKKRQQDKLREAQVRREKALKDQMAAEEQAEEERELQGVRSQYIDNIAAVVRGNWRRPSNVDKDVSCLIVVTQIPGGEIISYKVSKCTGDKAFQYSVERAVSKTSHLPTPPDPRVFDRVIRFTFTGK